MKKAKQALLAALLAALAGGAYWAVRGERAPTNPAAKTVPPVPVGVATAETGEIPVLLNLVGRAEAYESVTLKSRVDGQVQAVLYNEGQAVAQGDVLLRLDPGDFAARVTQAEAVVARDAAQLAKAQGDTRRYDDLKARGFVSDEKVNEVRTAERAAAATLQADQAALELARLQLSYTTIRAPFAGIVGARLVFPGSAVKTNDTVLAVVNRVQPLNVSFSVPERHAERLRRQLASAPLAVRVALPGGRSEAWTARADFIDNAVDPASGTILLKARFDNRAAGLTPGQFLDVSLVLDTLRDAVLVPDAAIQQGADGNYLYVVKPDQTAEMRKVAVHTSYRGRSALSGGVAAGETVVVDGQLRLAPGSPVQSRPSGEAAAPTR